MGKNKKKKKGKGLLVGSAAAAGAFTALNGFILYEVMNKNGKLIGKIAQKQDEEKAEAKIKAKEEAKENGAEIVETPRPRWTYETPCEEIIINNRNLNLKGYYYPANEPSDTFAFCIHGYRSTAKWEYAGIAQYYHNKGYNVFMMDHQGSGESEGNNISFGYYEKIDCMKWLEYLLERFGNDIKIILHGISMGSATAMLMSSDNELPENVKLTVADCGYTTVDAQFTNVLHSAHFPAYPIIKMTNLLNKLVYKFEYSKVRPIDAVVDAKVPILFVHGGNDTFIDPNMAYELYNACTSPKDLLIIEGADHAESFDVNPKLYSEKLDEFIGKYLEGTTVQ